MARSLWSGSISFGLVNVPVGLYSGVRDLDVHFHQIEKKTKARVEVKRVCAKEDTEVDWEDIAHGYEVGDTTVMLTDEELAGLAPERTKTIDIEAFVALEEIEPEYFDHPYLLAPSGGEGAARSYRLLAEVMRRTDRVAIGRFVLRSREYLVALRAQDDRLSLCTLLFADEIRSVKALKTARVTAKDRPSDAAVKRTAKLLRAMTTDFDIDHYEDRHRQRVEKLVARKRKGTKIAVEPDPETPAATPDLMAALRASLDRIETNA